MGKKLSLAADGIFKKLAKKKDADASFFSAIKMCY